MTASPTLRRALTDVAAFSRLFLPRWELRPYQTAPAQAIFDRACRRDSAQLGIVFSRQSGKDELLAQVLAALLVRHSRSGGSIVSVGEDDILKALHRFASMGLFVEPTSAIVGASLDQLYASGKVRAGETTVALLSGSGLKASAFVTKLFGG